MSISPTSIPPRVLHIVAGLDIGQTFGGAERSGVQLAMEMARTHVASVMLCAFWQCGGDAERFWLNALRKAGVATHFASPSSPTRDFRATQAALSNIARFAQQQPFDVVHAHHEGGTMAALRLKRAGLAKAALRTVYVPTAREWGNDIGAWGMRLATTQVLFPLQLDAEVAVAPQFVTSLNRRPIATLLQRKAHLIYNTSAEMPPAQVGPPLPIQPTDRVIGTLARLTEQKGLTYLIDAAPTVLASEPNALFLIAGDGEDRPALETQAVARGVRERVVFAGRRDDGAHLLKQMHLFVLPSLWEGVPLALIEAALAGVPIVTTDIDGNRELIADGVSGWAVPPKNAPALANAMLDALHHPDVAAQRAAKAQQVAREKFSLPALAAQYVALYQRLLNKRSTNMQIDLK